MERLARLVAEKGTKWAAIAPEFGRTPEQCRDKWRDMGGAQYQHMASGAWVCMCVCISMCSYCESSAVTSGGIWEVHSTSTWHLVRGYVCMYQHVFLL
jgi:hypothetical protein